MKTPFFKDKTVLVTGGTGTFGHAFVTKMLEMPIDKLIVFSRDEFKQSEMRRAFGNNERLRFFIGDVRDRERLVRAFQDVDIVVHAAALKQVPATEYNPTEAIKTNVIGTQNVIEAALDAGVSRVVTISSDKAVHPVNLYGATKLCAEKITVAANVYRRSSADKPRLSVVRYGNILGSRGSLLELIEKQRASGTVTLTDKRMTRFWMRIEKVMERVIEAIEIMRGGEIFVPKMESLKVVDVIECVAKECEIKVIGIRPGEKIHEVLITEHEAPRTIDIGDMYAILPEQPLFDNEKQLSGKSVARDFIYRSDHPDFLRSAKDASRILSISSTISLARSRQSRRRAARHGR
ncbi:MAG: hypothetical protein RLZZ416_522 [Candidatus Parcubacteria bacterium]|jgi:UDP-N-acetylglucosamine 4,6-dehydratase